MTDRLVRTSRFTILPLVSPLVIFSVSSFVGLFLVLFFVRAGAEDRVLEITPETVSNGQPTNQIVSEAWSHEFSERNQEILMDDIANIVQSSKKTKKIYEEVIEMSSRSVQAFGLKYEMISFDLPTNNWWFYRFRVVIEIKAIDPRCRATDRLRHVNISGPIYWEFQTRLTPLVDRNRREFLVPELECLAPTNPGETSPANPIVN